jgi:hypothetical protein
MRYTPEQVIAVAKRGREIDNELNGNGYFRPWDEMNPGNQKMYIDLALVMMLALDELRETW